MKLEIEPHPPRQFPPEADARVSANAYKLVADRLRNYAGGAEFTNPSDWADEYRVMGLGSNFARWSTARTPFLREIGEMIASEDPAHMHVCVAKCSQVGMSEQILNTLLWKIHQDPCSMLIYHETMDKAKAWADTRLLPALRLPPFNESSEYQIKGNNLYFPAGFLMWFGANSSTAVSSTAARIVVADEISKYPISISQEGDWLSLASARTSSFLDKAKIVLLSTPKDEVMEPGSFFSMIERGDRKVWRVPCRHCSELVLWDIKDVVRYEEDGKVHYGIKCPNKKCGKITRDGAEREETVAKGEWHATKTPRPGFVSYLVSGLHSPFKPLDKLYNRYEEAMDGTGGSLQAFYNTELGRFYSAPEARNPLSSDVAIKMTKLNYKKGVIPNEVCVIVCGIDVQQGYLVWEIRGYAPRFENFSIDKGHIKIPVSDTSRVVSALRDLANKPYKRQDGKFMQLRMITIDEGYMTSEVRALLNHFPRPNWDDQYVHFPSGTLVAVRGNSKAANTKLIVSTPGDRDSRGAKRRTPYVLLGVDCAKMEIYRSLTILESEDKRPFGKMHAPNDPDYDEKYFKELVAEQLVIEHHARTGALQTVFRLPSRTRCESLDCAVYARAAMSLMGADLWDEDRWQAAKEQECIEKMEKAPEPQLSQEELREKIKQKRRAEQEARRRAKRFGK